MRKGNEGNSWERTNVTNLLRNEQSGTYYARVRVNGKQKWKSLRTKLPSVAKLKLADFEKEVRAQGAVAVPDDGSTRAEEATVGRFIGIYRSRTANDSSLAPTTKSRRDIAVKALEKTWPGLANRDARRVTPTDCQEWAKKALREGTGFVAPNAKAVKRAMSASAFNKCVDTLRGIFEIAREHGVVYQNPAESLSKSKMPQKRLELPTVAQFHSIVKSIAAAGARQSRDCADFARGLAYSGTRKAEANALCWLHVDRARGQVRIPGTKSDSSLRVIPLFPALKALLDEIQMRRGAEPDNAPVFRVSECEGALTAACKVVGVKRLTHHDLRHLFATRCIESGVDIPTVSRWLGHSDGGALAMRVYGHLRQEHSLAQAARVTF